MERIRINTSSIILTLALILILIIAYFTHQLLLLSLVGIGIGVLLSPILNFFNTKLHLPKAPSAILMIVLFSIVFGLLLIVIYYLISDQAQDLSERAPQIYDSINNRVSEVFNNRPRLRDQLQNFDLGKTFRNSLINIVKGFRSGILAVGLVVFALVIGLYTAIYSKVYFEKSVEAFPIKYREKASLILLECASVLRGWFKAQLIDMLIIGLLTAAGLWIAGVKYWAIFGLLTAVLGIIPFVGIIIVVTVSALITLASDPSKVVWVLLIYGITQQLESHVIIPMVMKGKAELPVVPLLIFMLIMTSFYGILGVFVAPALFAIFRVLYIRIYLERLEKSPI